MLNGAVNAALNDIHCPVEHFNKIRKASLEAAWNIDRPRCRWAASTEGGLEAAQNRLNDECKGGICRGGSTCKVDRTNGHQKSPEEGKMTATR